jgi:hypothetical protein
MQIIQDGTAAGLGWPDITMACETTIAMVVASVVEMEDRPDKMRFATELVDLMTERAHRRVTALMQGVPDTG